MALKGGGCDVRSGGSERDQLIIANVHGDDFLHSRMHAVVFSTGQWFSQRCCAGCSPMCQSDAAQKWLGEK